MTDQALSDPAPGERPNMLRPRVAGGTHPNSGPGYANAVPSSGPSLAAWPLQCQSRGEAVRGTQPDYALIIKSIIHT